MHRFFITDRLDRTRVLLTDGDEVHHLRDVLRCRPGQTVRLFNDHGEEVAAVVDGVDRRKVVLKVIERLDADSRNEQGITLACAVPKRSKFETIIEKAVELGVERIVPLVTRRTEVRWDAGRAAGKLRRFRTVAVAAAKQCGRRRLPEIDPPSSFKDFLAGLRPGDLNLIPCLTDPRRPLACVLREEYRPSRRVTILIGPEGDFTPSEREHAAARGCRPVSLGPLVLRVETAAVAAAAAVRFHALAVRDRLRRPKGTG